MRNTALLFSILMVISIAADVRAQDDLFREMKIISVFQRPFVMVPGGVSSRIKNIQAFDAGSGIAYTNDSLFRTDDGGETWRELTVQASRNHRIAAVFFEDRNSGSALLVNPQSGRLDFAQTIDGGQTWTRTPITLRSEDMAEADLEYATLRALRNGLLTLEFRIPTSSNFSGVVRYESGNNGGSWEFAGRSVFMRGSDEASEKRSGLWSLITEGNCSNFKTGCVQETRILTNGQDITPSQIKEIARVEKEKASRESQKVPMFASAPGGSTRISLNRGFDKCTAAPASQMQIWWDNSPFYDANIYMSGRNRACSQPQLTAAWVNQVSQMGWGLIPTIVGYQSPCTASATTQKFSSDPAVAETQGRGEADIAIADANNLGLTAGTVLYYDMERYDDISGTGACSTPTKAFLKGWTDRLKEQGYISGVYGSPKNAMEDWVNIPITSRMDAIWMARWDNVPSVWTYLSFPAFPTNVWNNHQRIKQWQAPHNETWGGITFNIDGNIADGPVAGAAIPKNKNADFDGDGKTDVSVFRPDTGQWFVSGSLGPTFSIYQFGEATDILTPGDFDGDGKTDFAVFRPGNATWYFRLKGGTFSIRQFGAPGDMPVAADYNADGKTDIALFRPSTGFWYIANSDSLNTFTTVEFGENGDRPVQADYDGDGKADIAVWRPSNGVWYVLGSAGNFFTTTWGLPTDRPAQGDYDGDGKADFAVFRDGVWYIIQTSAGVAIRQFGDAGDLPATGDFDGDGRYDIAVFRPSNGNWYLSQSQNGYIVREFGISNDKPIPTAYMPQ